MSKPQYKRAVFQTLLKRLREPRRFIQVLAGPRQAGKTVLARQLMEALPIPSHYASADEPTQFRIQRKLVIGGQGIPVEECLLKPAEAWLK
ncbi:MAG TPA: hypothetical protein VNL14_06680 [Candidatus Acidoferrales bacterium]|nr:hypothetical protein [Candidatus Acidoferrales bacterium]